MEDLESTEFKILSLASHSMFRIFSESDMMTINVGINFADLLKVILASHPTFL